MTKEFNYYTNIYYEDTDAGGVVYYANYLKFFERARSEAIYSVGLSNKKLLDEYNIMIIVRSCNIEYKKPAFFEDRIEILSKINQIKNTSITMNQVIKKNNEIITKAEIVLVTVNKKGKPQRIPEILLKSLN